MSSHVMVKYLKKNWLEPMYWHRALKICVILWLFTANKMYTKDLCRLKISKYSENKTHVGILNTIGRSQEAINV